MVRIVPRNDPESAVLAYMEREKPLKSVLQGYANRNARKTMQKVTALLERMGYDGKNANTVLIRQADPRTIRDLEEIAERLPAKERRQVLAKMYGQIGTGTLTVKRAVNDLLRYGPIQDADRMYADAKGVLRKTASEGMLRGEFMVQKSLGVGWQTETPNIKGVDAFLHRQWNERDATDYLKPMGQVMKDQVTESIFLGESPQKMSQRMQRVEDISKVRADRNARTITTAVANEAQMDSYKKDGVKQYQWVATFDERTCPACGAKDGKKYPMGNGDYPPLHPNCRCTTIAVLSKAIQDRLNANLALHKDDYKAKYVDPNTTYQEWKNANVTDKPTKNPLKDIPKAPPKSQARATLEKYNVEYRPVEKLEKPETTANIIKKVGGPDKTDGSCSSLALAYAGNKNGLDVTDYRGGRSQEVFSSGFTVNEICDICDGWSESGKNDVKVVKKLLDDHVEDGKEYYLGAGKHASIVRKVEGRYEYLELQSTEERNGFKPLGPGTLIDRFRCRKSGKYEMRSVLIDIDNMKDNPEMENLLGFINTQSDKQMKGVGGHAK